MIDKNVVASDEMIERWAIKLALGNNGGEWASHYTDEQKKVWRKLALDFYVGVCRLAEVVMTDRKTGAPGFKITDEMIQAGVNVLIAPGAIQNLFDGWVTAREIVETILKAAASTAATSTST